MNEEFLEFLWVNRSYYLPLETTEGEPVYVMNPGIINHDGGPDLFNAIIRMEKTIWAGNVELHVRSSDWYHHGHQNDSAYDNVILHVVFEHDAEVKSSKGTAIPCVELSGKFDPALQQVYEKLNAELGPVPCGNFLDDISLEEMKEEIRNSFFRKLERKKEVLSDLYSYYGNHSESAFYTFLFRSFGFRVNALPFELLSKSFDYRLILKYSDRPEKIGALLFGQSGLLPEKKDDDYLKELWDNYLFLSKKHDLKPLIGCPWKFLRMRPAGFPTVRLAQLSAILSQGLDLYRVLSGESLRPEGLHSIFAVSTHPYWDDHYTFERTSKKYEKVIGRESAISLYVGFLLPFHAFRRDMEGKGVLKDEVIRLLTGLPPESNMITRKFTTMGLSPSCIIDSHGMTELKMQSCDQGMCLRCPVGRGIILRHRV